MGGPKKQGLKGGHLGGVILLFKFLQKKGLPCFCFFDWMVLKKKKNITPHFFKKDFFPKGAKVYFFDFFLGRGKSWLFSTIKILTLFFFSRYYWGPLGGFGFRFYIFSNLDPPVGGILKLGWVWINFKNSIFFGPKKKNMFSWFGVGVEFPVGGMGKRHLRGGPKFFGSFLGLD